MTAGGYRLGGVSFWNNGSKIHKLTQIPDLLLPYSLSIETKKAGVNPLKKKRSGVGTALHLFLSIPY